MKMMTIKQHLNDDYRRPIKWLLEDCEADTVKEVMSYVDTLCHEYEHLNLMSRYQEEVLVKAVGKDEAFKAFKPHEYMEWEYERFDLTPYDDMKSAYTKQELKEMKRAVLTSNMDDEADK